MAGELFRRLENRQLEAVFADGDLLADTYLVRGDVDLAAIHLNVSVTHQLAGLAAGHAESQAIDHVVQAALQLLQEQFAGDALGARGLLEVITELAFLGEVNTLGLLFLSKLQAVAHDLRLAVLAMLARSKIALLDGTLIAEAFGAFEE